MKEKWIEYAKKADFDLWARELGISPLTARVLRNRDVMTLEEARSFLYGTVDELEDARHMKDMDRAVALLSDAIRRNEKIAVSSDFDDDGIFAGEILYESLTNCGASVKLYTPSRVAEGYGLNERIVDQAASEGCRVILTCDNGIAAVGPIAYAKERGFTVIVTDHHEPQPVLPPADAIVDPKQKDCPYGFKHLCGAGVAFRLSECLYRAFGIEAARLRELYEYVAIATVVDIVELRGENRILVRAGLERLRATEKTGLKALIDACGISAPKIASYHLSFVIGPCFNSVGRLADVSMAFRLLQTKDPQEAKRLAEEIRDLNEVRKAETEAGLKQAEELIGTMTALDPVLFIRLPGVHESIVGIIASKIKEEYNHPVFVFTESGRTADGCVLLKGSGRSVAPYHMTNALIAHGGLMERFGGHAMAAGLTVREDRFEELKAAINADCGLTEDDLRPVVHIDARLPFSWISEDLIRELSALEPFGAGNPKPVFARPNIEVHYMKVIGRTKQVLKMIVSDTSGVKREAICFDGCEELQRIIEAGPENLAFAYYPSVNEYQGEKTLQITVQSYCVLSNKSV